MPSVLQPWVQDLSFMKQSVLIAGVRGPDGIQKDHVAKVMLRWFRRCIMYSAFDGRIYDNPYSKGGGSFMGPVPEGKYIGKQVVDEYLRCVDELPHHFQLHFMHGAEILGYDHPNEDIRRWWHDVYCRIVRDAHLGIETKEQMDYRLGDNEKQWRENEEVTAK